MQGCNARAPVFAAPRTSRPVSRWGIVLACTSVMCLKPISAIALCVCSVRSSVENSAALMIPLTLAVTRSTSTPFFACKKSTLTHFAIRDPRLASAPLKNCFWRVEECLLGDGCRRIAILSPAACCCLLSMLPWIMCIFLGCFNLLIGLGFVAKSGCLFGTCKSGVASVNTMNMLRNLLYHKTQHLQGNAGCKAVQAPSAQKGVSMKHLSTHHVRLLSFLSSFLFLFEIHRSCICQRYRKNRSIQARRATGAVDRKLTRSIGF